MKPTYTTELTKLDLVLLRDTLDYVMHHFTAEDPEDGQMFEFACRDLQLRLSVVRHRAGVPETDTETAEHEAWMSSSSQPTILH